MKCPGQDSQYWNKEAIYEVDCPNCGIAVEFYKDDTTRKCHGCGHRFVNPRMDFGCAAYCQFAEQCIGDLPEEFVAGQDSLLKDKVAVEMKRHLKSDFRRIGHACRVARYVEQICKEEGGNIPVLLCTSYISEIAAALDTPGPDLARDILSRLKAKEPITEAVCELLNKKAQGVGQDSDEAFILQDAETLACLEESLKSAETVSPVAGTRLRTAIGQDIFSRLAKVP